MSKERPGARVSRISVIGTGYVGLTTLVGLSQLGHTCVGFDINEEKLDMLTQGEIPIYEPGLGDGLLDGLKNGSISFTNILSESVKNADFVFICVSTPENSDGSADISRVVSVAQDLTALLAPGAVVITKSTVPVGTGQKVREKIDRPDISIASNPEFLREGTSLFDFHNPDRIVIGSDDSETYDKIANLYEKLNSPKFQASLMEAELIKYAANSFLAVKLSFTNEIAALCEIMQIDARNILRAVGADSRIGSKFLIPGPGWGGSCFPKDTKALVHIANNNGFSLSTVSAAISSNKNWQMQIANRIIESALKVNPNPTIAFWGLAFKAETDDLRESPSLALIERILDAGITIRAFDFEAHPEPASGLTICFTPEDACNGSDLLVVGTEWKQFGELDPSLYLSKLNSKIIFDLRNILNYQNWENSGAKVNRLGVGL